MTSENSSNLLITVCDAFESRAKEKEFAEALLQILSDNLRVQNGLILHTKNSLFDVVASSFTGENDSEKATALISLVRSALTDSGTVPSTLILDQERYGAVKLRDYGYAFFNFSPLKEEPDFSPLQHVADHAGRLLGILEEKSILDLRIRQSEQLSLLATRTTDIIMVTDLEGFITFVNESFCKQTGYSREESIGRRPSELLHGPETDPETIKNLLDGIMSHRITKVEVLNYKKNREKFWLDLTIESIFNDEGDCVALASIGRDITEGKKYFREIIHKENMLRSVVASSNEFLVNSDIVDAISKSLPILGNAVDVDRVYFFRNTLVSDDHIVTSQICEWNSGYAKSQINNPDLQNLLIDSGDPVFGSLFQGKHVSIIVSQMLVESSHKTLLESQDVKSLLIFPIMNGDFFYGLMGFDECRIERTWAEDEISILRHFCITISKAVQRAKVVDELMNLYLFPKESPAPLVRTDLQGKVVISNAAAEKIVYFIHEKTKYSFEEFFRKVAREINGETPKMKYEVVFEEYVYLITSVLSANQIHINNYVIDITDFKKSQIELERLSLVAMNYSLGVYFTDQDLKITYANSALLKITGYSLEEIIGRTPVDVFHGPLTQYNPYKKLLFSHQSVSPVEVDIILYRKDKSFFWANIKKQPLNKRDDGVQEFFSIIEDISEKKRVEDSLRNSETRTLELIKNLKESILLDDENCKVILTNANFCKLFNISLSPEELIGVDCKSTIVKVAGLFKEPETFITRVSEIIKVKQPVLMEEIEMADGHMLERDYTPILIDNVLKGHLWKYSDISERKNRERLLLQQEMKYRNIIANMKMGLLETDIEDRITYVNQELCEMSGYSINEIIGKKSVELLVADDYKESARSKYNARNKGVSDTYQILIRLRNGEYRWWLTSAGPNFNDNGELTGTIGISVDITDQKKLEQELEISRQKAEESSKAKEAFLASMSHEIRTPMNVIIGMLRELTREKLTDKQQLYLRNAELSSHHLLSIVNDVLDITKIASGQLNLDLSSFSLTELIHEIIQMMTPEAKEKMLNLSETISQILAPIYIGDANRIKQVLINIISNSIKFTDEGGISVECALVSKSRNIHQIKIKISDTGIGMEESFLEHIFDKFSQGDYSSARKTGGTGLGMAISYELMKMMKGSIVVSSRIGIGTTTEIILDLEVGSVEEIRTSIVSESFEDLKGRSILLVEDSDLNRLVALNSLNYYGLVATEAINGYEAIEKIKDSKFDAVLMDLQMPVMGGIEATKIIREELKITVPIIALTAHSFKAEIDRCLEAGMNDYIIKPFEENTLMSVLVRNIKEAPGFSPKKVEDNKNDNDNISTAKLYNLDAIVKMSRGNRDFINRIIQVFIEQTPEAVDEIKTAWEKKDMDTIRKLAHKMKPNLDNFGISDLKKDIRIIESMAEEGTVSQELDEKIKKLDSIVKSVVNDLALEKF